MQVTLCFVLLCTLGVAALVSHQRSKSLNVELGPPHQWGRLSMRLPLGWTVQDGHGFRWYETDCEEPKRSGRSLIIHQNIGVTLRADIYLRSQLRTQARSIEPFDFLGEHGYLVITANQRDPSNPSQVFPGALYACVVARELGVIVTLEGEGVDGPSGRKLLRQVTDSLQRENPPPGGGG